MCGLTDGATFEGDPVLSMRRCSVCVQGHGTRTMRSALRLSHAPLDRPLTRPQPRRPGPRPAGGSRNVWPRRPGTHTARRRTDVVGMGAPAFFTAVRRRAVWGPGLRGQSFRDTPPPAATRGDEVVVGAEVGRRGDERTSTSCAIRFAVPLRLRSLNAHRKRKRPLKGRSVRQAAHPLPAVL